MKRTLLAICGLLSTIGSAGIVAEEPNSESAISGKPNLLLIVADDMGYGDLSCYGSEQIPTPHLDQLAAGGARCTDGYVSGSVCSPSRAGLMTGRYGSRFGYEHNLSRPKYLKPEFAGIPLTETLFPERLQDLGYRTGIVGKWHLGSSVPEHHPLERGFDQFFGMLGGSHSYWPAVHKNNLFFGYDRPKQIRTPYLTDWFTLEAMDFIKSEGFAGNNEVEDGSDGDQEDRPWFLYLSYNTPHSPMQAKDEDLARFADIKPEKRRIYCAMQACMDDNIGKILELLRQRGEYENTLIVFISDNGGSVEVSHAINAPLRGTKGTFLEGGIRVPTIWHWPARIKPQVYQQPVISLDIAASFVVAAGGEWPGSPDASAKKARGKKSLIYDGIDLLSFFSGESKKPPHQHLYWRTALRGSALRSGNWKIVRPNNQPIQLYDLSTDVSELNDLSDEHPEVLQRLLNKYVDWESSLKQNPMFMSSSYWTKYNRKLYNAKYQLTQPRREARGRAQ